MNLPQKIAELIAAGMTQEAIESKTGITQSKISRLANSVTREPRWKDVCAINELHNFVVVRNKDWSGFKPSNQSDVTRESAT